MGFISTVVIYNDSLHELAEDPTFGKRVEQAILGLYVGKPRDIGHYGQAIESHHNSGLMPVLVGHSTGVPLLTSKDNTELELDLLKRLADSHGFHLRKKPKKR